MPRTMKSKRERIILLIAGESGAGKSYFVANLQKALIFDTDIGGGLSYAAERIERNGSEVVPVTSYVELGRELRRRKLTEFNSIAIDHLSTLHQEAVIRHNPTFERDYGNAADNAAKEWRKVRQIIAAGDFHLICTSHLKGRWENDKQIGETADAAKKIEGDFHTVLHVRNDYKLDNWPKQARVVKWRRDPEDARGKVPPSFPFTVANFLKIHGLPIDDPRDEKPLASEEQVAEFDRLLGLVKLPDGTLERWKKNSQTPEPEDWKAKDLDTRIAYMRGLVAPLAEEPKPLEVK